jgi:hypothetical protein
MAMFEAYQGAVIAMFVVISAIFGVWLAKETDEEEFEDVEGFTLGQLDNYDDL